MRFMPHHLRTIAIRINYVRGKGGRVFRRIGIYSARDLVDIELVDEVLGDYFKEKRKGH